MFFFNISVYCKIEAPFWQDSPPPLACKLSTAHCLWPAPQIAYVAYTFLTLWPPLQGLNRIGNLLVPNDNYSRFEDWMIPILDAMLHEQQASYTATATFTLLGLHILTETLYQHTISLFNWHTNLTPPLLFDFTETLRSSVVMKHRTVLTGHFDFACALGYNCLCRVKHPAKAHLNTHTTLTL